MGRFLGAVAAMALVVGAAVPAGAFVKLEGYFVALDACTTGRSISESDDAGMPETERRHAYDIIGKNKPDHTHYQIRMPEVFSAPDRWVAAECGVHAVPTIGPAPVTGGGGDGDLVRAAPVAESTDNLLAASWQPGFCETKPGKTECQALNGGGLPEAGGQFSIHGLWPQPNGTFYCGVTRSVARKDKSATWHELPAPEVDAATEAALEVAMPGVQSHLHHHEWIKHGTCYGAVGGADEYYDDTLMLMAELNASAVGQLFAANIGGFLSGTEIRRAFDDAFGMGAGARVRIDCDEDRDSGRTVIVELKINLGGQIEEGRSLRDLIPTAPSTDMGCAGGIVDPVGDQ